MRFLYASRPALTLPLSRCLTQRQFMQLFVGGLSYDTNESVLKDAFEKHGEIIEVKVICDRVSGKSRGYGFVRYSTEEAATKALEEMDGWLLDGRNIRVRNAYSGGSKEVRWNGEETLTEGLIKEAKVSTQESLEPSVESEA